MENIFVQNNFEHTKHMLFNHSSIRLEDWVLRVWQENLKRKKENFKKDGESSNERGLIYLAKNIFSNLEQHT